MEKAAIDLVYLWVDGSDPRWIQKKEKFTGTLADAKESNAKGRYSDNDELKYSLRSVEKHLPWIRNIFLVTDHQKPEWLNTDYSKIQLIDHKDIMPHDILPCFNSNVIEYYFYKIPHLSEHFLYANDDMLFNAGLKPDFFFAADGYPFVRLKKDPFGKTYNTLRTWVGKKPGEYRHIIYEALSIIEEKFGKFYPGVPHHNVDAYRKSDYKTAVEDIFKDEVVKSSKNKVRTFEDLQRLAFSLYPLSKKHAHLQYVNKKISLRNQLYKRNFRERMAKYNPKLFCMNDSQKATDEDRKAAKAFLEERFPEKSAFEK